MNATDAPLSMRSSLKATLWIGSRVTYLTLRTKKNPVTMPIASHGEIIQLPLQCPDLGIHQSVKVHSKVKVHQGQEVVGLDTQVINTLIHIGLNTTG